MRITEKLTPVAAAMSALATLACCLPLGIAGALGALGLSIALERLRPWLTGLAVVLLGMSAFQMYRGRKSCRPAQPSESGVVRAFGGGCARGHDLSAETRGAVGVSAVETFHEADLANRSRGGRTGASWRRLLDENGPCARRSTIAREIEQRDAFRAAVGIQPDVGRTARHSPALANLIHLSAGLPQSSPS